MKKRILALMLVLSLSPALAFSTDFKDWLPYVPNSLGGKKMTGKDEAGNVSINGFTSSSLVRTYGSEPDETILMIVWDPSGRQMMAVKMGMSLRFDTPEAIAKPITVQGFPTLFQFNAESGRGTLQILPTDTALVQLNAKGNRDESHYINMLKSVNLKKILSTMK